MANNHNLLDEAGRIIDDFIESDGYVQDHCKELKVFLTEKLTFAELLTVDGYASILSRMAQQAIEDRADVVGPLYDKPEDWDAADIEDHDG